MQYEIRNIIISQANNMIKTNAIKEKLIENMKNGAFAQHLHSREHSYFPVTYSFVTKTYLLFISLLPVASF